MFEGSSVIVILNIKFAPESVLVIPLRKFIFCLSYVLQFAKVKLCHVNTIIFASKMF